MSDGQQSREGQAQQVAAEVVTEDFKSFLRGKFEPAGPRVQNEVVDAVQAFVAFLADNGRFISESVHDTIKQAIAEIDRLLSAQVNEILHNEDFQKLEGAWRGLKFLVDRTKTGDNLQIKVLPISKAEIVKVLRSYPGAMFEHSPLYKKLYSAEYDHAGGHPYGCVVGDYHFDHSPQDVEILRGMGKIARDMHAPFIAGAAPSLFELSGWQELPNPTSLSKRVNQDTHAEWRALRDSEESRYIGLAMPRILARRPYGPKDEPVEAFAFEETIASPDARNFTWANAAYAMASNITRAFSKYGWCMQIRGLASGGAVEDLPTYTFPTDDGSRTMLCPSEVGIPDTRGGELEQLGLMPLCHYKRSNMAAFFGAQSLQRAKRYDDPDAQANANLSASLSYLFGPSRFAHYLKCMVRDMVGEQLGKDELQIVLQNWFNNNYVLGNPSTANAEDKAKRPLSEANVAVEEIEGKPGFYAAKVHLKPHFQLEGVSVAMSLVAKIPPRKQ